MALFLWKCLYWAWLATEVLLLLVTRTSKIKSGGVRDRGSIFVLWIVIFCSIWGGSWYAQTHASTILGSVHSIRMASLGLMGAGLLIRWVSILTLGRAFSVNVAIRAGQTLYRKGLFAFVRHPSYLGMMLIFAAIGLRSRNWFALAIFTVPPLLALMYRMQVEEAALGQAFGDEYAEYSKTTKRLIPGLY